MTDEINNRLITFADRVENFYGRLTTISESLSVNKTNFDRHFTTYGQYQLKLENVTWRTSGGRMTFSQGDLFYEVSIDNLVTFQENEDGCFEFLEKYSESIFRRTIIEFKEL